MIRLNDFESDTTSQFGENGIVGHIFDHIGIRSKVTVEFGAADGISCSNSAPLWRDQGWKAVLVEPDPSRFEELEGNAGPFNVVCRQTLITPDGTCSIDSILNAEGVSDVDYMSIDVDGDDIYIFESLLCRPRVVSIEFNPTVPPHLDVRQSGLGETFGASLLACVRAGQRLGYRFIGATYCNAFFVIEEEAKPFDDYETDLAVLFPPDIYTYAVTDFSGKVVLVGQPPPWGLRNPYVQPLNASTNIMMPTDSVQHLRRGFESFWGPARWLSVNGLDQARYHQILTERSALVCIDMTSVPGDSDLERWLLEDARSFSYRPLYAGRLLGLINEGPNA